MQRILVIATIAGLMYLGIVFGVGGCLERQGLQPDARINPTTGAQQPTATQHPTRTQEPQPTPTPGPDFAAMQRTIDEQVADLNEQRAQFYADIEQDALEAATEKAREEINQLRRMYDADYTAKLEDLEHQRRTNAEAERLQLALHDSIVNREAAINASAVRSAQKLDEWNALIKVGVMAAWRILGLVAVAAGIVLIFIKVAQNNEHDADLLRMAHAYEDQLRTIHQEVTEKAKAEALRYNQIRDYVRDSVKVAGGDYHQFPPASDPGMAHWHNDLRTQIVGYMQSDGVVFTNNRGTFVKKGTLAELLDDIERGEYPAGGE